MKPLLMYPDRDFDLQRQSPLHDSALVADLELETLFAALSRGDEFLADVARRALLASEVDLDTIAYRHDVLRDCLRNAAVVREIYELVVESIAAEKTAHLGFFSRSPHSILQRSLKVMELFRKRLERLRRICDEHAGEFHSAGLRTLAAMLSSELDDAYLATVDVYLRDLRFRHGMLVSAELDGEARGTNHVLRRPRGQSWKERISVRERSSYSFQIERDDNDTSALDELRNRGINLVANALTQATDHILGFLCALRAELGMYIGCVNLHEQLVEKGEPTCFPTPVSSEQPQLHCRGLYDVCLSLRLSERAVANDVSADGKALIVVTGANQGGKSTFLRSIGVAQLMMQCGMFVAAESFQADVRVGLFTHFRREEDATMESGKLDEELSRMSEIVDHMRPHSMLLCNESFAATNEREGSEIARQILRALLEADTKVVFVTHMFDLADGLYGEHQDDRLFLRAERLTDGLRTFRLVEREPLRTSYGEDLYRRIFGVAPGAADTE